ncbi:MAG: hypothetical protein NZ550_05775 [Fimbriimonadales bacterium]|nr:hypothetical protein [Fimbriimonadales bacterium]MDW8052714.1 hypothetical protein [Armatimonadota bacterium]
MRAWLVVLAIALMWAGTTAQKKTEATPIKTSIAAILKDPDKFHRKLVQVQGTVSELKKKVSRAGNEYTTFKLVSEGKQLPVFSYGHLDIQEKDRVVVTGRFYKVKRVGRLVFRNEIDASPKEGGKVERKQ